MSYEKTQKKAIEARNIFIIGLVIYAVGNMLYDLGLDNAHISENMTIRLSMLIYLISCVSLVVLSILYKRMVHT